MFPPHFALALLLSSVDIKIYNEHTYVPVKGTHFIFMGTKPETFELDVSTAFEGRTTLQLTPERENRRLRFSLEDKQYDLEYRIECEQHFFGKNCDVYCRRNEGSHFSCSSEGEQICDDGWTGDKCTTKIDPCSSSPCLNGGQCLPVNSRVFSCNCQNGFEGMLCDRQRTTSTPAITTSVDSSSTSVSKATSETSTPTASTRTTTTDKEMVVHIEGSSFNPEDDSCWKLVFFIAIILILLVSAILFAACKLTRRRKSPSALLQTTVSSKEKSFKKIPLSRTVSPRYVTLPFAKHQKNSSPPEVKDYPPAIYLSRDHTIV